MKFLAHRLLSLAPEGPFQQLAKWQEENRQREDERRRLESLPPEFVIHTVHGTFASKAKWIEPDSSFGKRLRSGLGWRARIEPFIWSGRNEVADRRDAARELKRRLEIKLDEYANARHVVVAHSHGGNIAFMAVDSLALADRVLGVVTLATPFLAARSRSGKELVDAGTGLFAALFAGWTTLFVGFYRGRGSAIWPWALVAFAVTLALLVAGQWVIGRMQKHAEWICSAMPKTALRPDQVAIVRVRGDEATAAIAGARLAGTLADFVWRIMTNRLFEWMNDLLRAWDYGGIRSFQERIQESYSKKMRERVLESYWKHDSASTPNTRTEEVSHWKTAWQTTVQTMPLFLIQMLQQGDRTTQVITMILIGMYGLPAAFAVATVALGIPFALLSSVSLVPCGLTVPLAGPYLDLTAEPSPPGSWTVTQFEVTRDERGLLHSEAHQDFAVRGFVADWIRKRAGNVVAVAD